MGASSSRSIGCDKKIYLDFRQIALISLSNNFESLEDFSTSLLMILSISIYSVLSILILSKFNILNYVYKKIAIKYKLDLAMQPYLNIKYSYSFKESKNAQIKIFHPINSLRQSIETILKSVSSSNEIKLKLK